MLVLRAMTRSFPLLSIILSVTSVRNRVVGNLKVLAIKFKIQNSNIDKRIMKQPTLSTDANRNYFLKLHIPVDAKVHHDLISCFKVAMAEWYNYLYFEFVYNTCNW